MDDGVVSLMVSRRFDGWVSANVDLAAAAGPLRRWRPRPSNPLMRRRVPLAPPPSLPRSPLPAPVPMTSAPSPARCCHAGAVGTAAAPKSSYPLETPDALATFVNSGWELGSQASAAAKAGEQGAAFQDALAIAPGIWLYQLTDKGVAVELKAKGTKYYKDDDLNG
jgi:hypothetical protein